MIIIILILAVILFIYFNVIPGKGHTLVSWISLIITLLCVLGIVEHDYNHWGLKTETQTSTQNLTSSVNPNLPILLYQSLGNVSTKVKQGKEASLKIRTTRYIYKDNFSRIMFSAFSHNNELKHREYIFTLPSNWKVISTKDMQKLQKQMQEKMQSQKAASLH